MAVFPFRLRFIHDLPSLNFGYQTGIQFGQPVSKLELIFFSAVMAIPFKAILRTKKLRTEITASKITVVPTDVSKFKTIKRLIFQITIHTFPP